MRNFVSRRRQALQESGEMAQKKRMSCEVEPFPKMRKIVVDFLRLARGKHTIHGLTEADVTHARRVLREYKARTGESLSFTAFIIACLGQAVDENKIVHAYRNWRNQLVLFDEVDISIIIEVKKPEVLAGPSQHGESPSERSEESGTFPFAHVLRAVNKRTVRDIHQEIRAIQTQPQSSRGLEQWGFMRWFLLMPSFVRQFFYRALFRRPHLVKEYAGTAGVTAVGMFGREAGWAIPMPVYTLSVAVGGIAEKPAVVDGRIEPREYLSMTLSFDHDIVDGAPAARFTTRFKELIESGYGLDDIG
jgi:pyruvate/2-oxoglutarate dehydrogenase complex dihydrolipoamide acyltransferase (E2) component